MKGKKKDMSEKKNIIAVTNKNFKDLNPVDAGKISQFRTEHPRLLAYSLCKKRLRNIYKKR